MSNYRQWGKKPFQTAILHGGPGMAGDVALLAQDLSKDRGVIEPLQTKNSVDDLIAELKEVLINFADSPVNLIGHSWGAMFAFIFASQHPALVKKLILVASGEFEEEYSKDIMSARMSRLSVDEKKGLEELLRAFDSPDHNDKNELFKKMGPYIHKTDFFDMPIRDNPLTTYNAQQYTNIWSEVESLRKSGELLSFGKDISCPVVVIHGDYDPHPFDGIKRSLSKVLPEERVTYHLLEKCGHYPWLEKHAKKNFDSILRHELGF